MGKKDSNEELSSRKMSDCSTSLLHTSTHIHVLSGKLESALSPPLLPAMDPTFGKRALEVLPVFITPCLSSVCLDLETKGTGFCWELQKAAQVTAHGTAQAAQGKVILSPPKSHPEFWDRVFQHRPEIPHTLWNRHSEQI